MGVPLIESARRIGQILRDAEFAARGGAPAEVAALVTRVREASGLVEVQTLTHIGLERVAGTLALRPHRLFELAEVFPSVREIYGRELRRDRLLPGPALGSFSPPAEKLAIGGGGADAELRYRLLVQIQGLVDRGQTVSKGNALEVSYILALLALGQAQRVLGEEESATSTFAKAKVYTESERLPEHWHIGDLISFIEYVARGGWSETHALRLDAELAGGQSVPLGEPPPLEYERPTSREWKTALEASLARAGLWDEVVAPSDTTIAPHDLYIGMGLSKLLLAQIATSPDLTGWEKLWRSRFGYLGDPRVLELLRRKIPQNEIGFVLRRLSHILKEDQPTASQWDTHVGPVFNEVIDLLLAQVRERPPSGAKTDDTLEDLFVRSGRVASLSLLSEPPRIVEAERFLMRAAHVARRTGLPTETFLGSDEIRLANAYSTGGPGAPRMVRDEGAIGRYPGAFTPWQNQLIDAINRHCRAEARGRYEMVPLRDLVTIHYLHRERGGVELYERLMGIRDRILLRLAANRILRDPEPHPFALQEAMRDDDGFLLRVSRRSPAGKHLLLNGHHRPIALATLVVEGKLPITTLEKPLPVLVQDYVDPEEVLAEVAAGVAPATGSPPGPFEGTGFSWLDVVSFDPRLVELFRRIGASTGLGVFLPHSP